MNFGCARWQARRDVLIASAVLTIAFIACAAWGIIAGWSISSITFSVTDAALMGAQTAVAVRHQPRAQDS